MVDALLVDDEEMKRELLVPFLKKAFLQLGRDCGPPKEFFSLVQFLKSLLFWEEPYWRTSMLWTVSKTLITTLIIVTIPFLSKKSTVLASLLAALPLVSVLAMIWMYVEGQEAKELASFSNAVFWMVLPSLPMFLLLPKLLEKLSFPVSLALGCALTTVLYLIMIRFVEF